ARSRGVGGKFIAGIESMFGGEITAFTSEVEKAREEALERLKGQAKAMGADAVIRTDFETTEIYYTTVLFSATGTAVKLEK
ncbi:MAG: heavy metal-binding domain-containing protein, partial [Candidatus Micrarchaeota archaeon]